ncbi:MAG TPA: iron ABC transporter permease [Candidatus Sulfomarinibacteraceae bacterium]|nr:iron ABC transporter permease [Candidatus Sulfomarinibacteraceae bacterium]
MTPGRIIPLPGKKARRLLSLFFFATPLLFLLAFFFFPLANILRFSLTAEAFVRFFSRPYYLNVLWFTIWQAALSTLLTLLIGLPGAYLFARYEFRGKALLRSLTTVPFVMPTVVVATAFRALLGANGPLNRALMALTGAEQAIIRVEQTLTIILLAHVFYNVTIVIRLVGGFWASLSPRVVEAARTMGAPPLRAFWEVTLPLLRPALIAASLLIYLFTFTSFGIILLLGGPAYSTVETEIYRQYVNFLRPDVAAALSLLQIVFTFVLMSLYARWQSRSAVALDFRPQSAGAKRPSTWRQWALVSIVITGLILFEVIPLLSLVYRSFVTRDGAFTLAYYEALPVLRRGSVTFIPPLEAVRNSIIYGLLTVVSAGILGTISARLLTRPGRWRRWLDPLFMLPLGASAVTLGFGYVVTFDRLRTSPLLVLIAHTLVAFPFVVRTVLPVIQGIKPSLREAAAVMGASPWRVWREIDLPIVGRALLVAAVFAFTVSMGEFGATSFIVRPNSGYLTMPIAIARYLGTPGALNFGQALAMSAILMLVTSVGFVAIERFRFADVGEF